MTDPSGLSTADRSLRLHRLVRIEQPVWIGRNVVVGAGAHLGPNVQLGDGSRVAPGVRLRNAIVWDGVEACHDVVDDVLVGP